MEQALGSIYNRYKAIDPRYFVVFLLLTYNILGMTILGFNRAPLQVILTAVSCVVLQAFYSYIFHKKFDLSLSAFITSLGLCLLVNYGHSYWYPLVPVYFAISSKYIFTFNNRHKLNPALMGVVLSILITNEFISASPAYQWNGIGAMSIFIGMPAILFFMPKVNRTPLVLSFLGVFTLQIIVRSLLIKHYLPFETLFFGTISSPAFFLFTFFMITDPVTTPNGRKEQIIAGVSLALLDLFFHLFRSYHTFFYAGLTYGGFNLIKAHYRQAKLEGSFTNYFKERFFNSGYYKKLAQIILLGLIGVGIHQYIVQDRFFLTAKPNFKFERITAEHSGLIFDKGDIFEQVDPRVQHMGKWILAITDGVALSDVNNDGLLDIFMTNGHKRKDQRNMFFINKGDFKFESLEIKNISEKGQDYKKYGVPSNAMFVDFDNDGDKDLYITYAFGKEGTSRLFKNTLSEEGKLNFYDVTEELGLTKFSNSATANFFDFNRDGKLDLILGNTIATHLPNYEAPTKLNLFELPQPQFEGDRRMFDFMHDSWHMANNGAVNPLFLQTESGFKELDAKSLNMTETRWTMALGTGDFNQDGFTDLYAANDFGPDDLYLNVKGETFKNVKGEIFGSIGRDTYKGMNATVADFDGNGIVDVYISNVHQALQAEGSLLWTFKHNLKGDGFIPLIEDKATYSGALNENRFGWGAGVGDFNNDGLPDLAQANGMVDNKYDATSDDCPDFWYINEKLARSPPSIHRYIDKWGDIRGTCIHGYEKNRLYLNRGVKRRPQFVDVADKIGMDQVGNWRGMAVGDLDNDGALDLVVSSLYRNPLVFKNILDDKAKQNNWFAIDLESNDRSCNREAIGSTVRAFVDDNGVERVIVMEKTLVNGFSAQSDRRMHFGLGKGKLKKVEVNWCGKEKKTYQVKLGKYQKLLKS
ncbi:MAG: hypothetical protein GY909_17075 [Oligoflexia bacterium]|nr:hypothetical protein [Oligoflexia bacterium]